MSKDKSTSYFVGENGLVENQRPEVARFDQDLLQFLRVHENATNLENKIYDLFILMNIYAGKQTPDEDEEDLELLGLSEIDMVEDMMYDKMQEIFNLVEDNKILLNDVLLKLRKSLK